jgi:hypothetical protein
MLGQGWPMPDQCRLGEVSEEPLAAPWLCTPFFCGAGCRGHAVHVDNSGNRLPLGLLLRQKVTVTPAQCERPCPDSGSDARTCADVTVATGM